MKSFISFSRKNKVSCNNVSIWRVFYEYVCWVLTGKPKQDNGYMPDIDLDVSAEHSWRRYKNE